MLDTVTDAQWREFDATGVVSLGVALAPAELGALSDRLDGIMMDAVDDVPYDRLLMQVEGGGGQTRGHKGAHLGYRKIQGLEHDPCASAPPQATMHSSQRACSCRVILSYLQSGARLHPAARLPQHRSSSATARN